MKPKRLHTGYIQGEAGDDAALLRITPASIAGSWLRRVTLLSLVTYAATLCCATAKDFEALADVVTPAYTAMNFAMICARDDPPFIQRTGGARGNALQYAEHVKNETIASLTYDEAVSVLRRAADAARSRARQELKELAIQYSDRVPAGVQRWCAGFAAKYIHEFIEYHDGNHERLLRQIEGARR